MKIYKKDAIILKQLQNYFDLKEKSVNQAEFFHKMLCYLFKHQQDFLKEVENQQQKNNKIFEKWMKILIKKMKEEEF